MTVAHQAIDARPTLTVTVDTPSHLHRGHTLDLRHLWHLAVTLLTGNSRLDVTLVIKLQVVRHYMHLHPRNRLTVLVVFLELLDVLLALLGLARYERPVTSHTGLNLWDSGVRSLGYGPVAVLTLHLVLLNVDDVAEVNRLLRFVTASSLRRTEVMEVVPDVKVPKCRLAVVENARANANLRII